MKAYLETRAANSIKKGIYIPVFAKFMLGHFGALFWVSLSVYLSLPWLKDLGTAVSFPVALIIIAGICYMPGYMNAFLVSSLLVDRQPVIKNKDPREPVTVIIAAHNEEDGIYNTLSYLEKQDYAGDLKIVAVNNRSSDNTALEIERAKRDFDLKIDLIDEDRPGKYNALNRGLAHVQTRYVITLDADTLLLPSSIRYLVARMINSPEQICAVAGSVLARNSRSGIWARIQEWDYFLGIASIKRLQGLYQGTLVAQGAYSIYKTDSLKAVRGWPDAIGEDIVLTWRLLARKWRVYYEPLAVAFTEVPSTFNHFVRQRSRWARGMIEGLKEIKPWHQPRLFTKYLTFVNLTMPYMDLVYTFCWIPGLLLAFLGYFWIVGPVTLLVLPLTVISYAVLYYFQKKQVFDRLNLKIRKNILGLILFIVAYQMVMSPASVYGYIQEIFKRERVWK